MENRETHEEILAAIFAAAFILLKHPEDRALNMGKAAADKLISKRGK